MGYTFRNLGPSTTSAGAPSTVDFVHASGQKLEFTFAAGSSLGIPTPGVYKDFLLERLQMVDANGWATLTEPVYYDLYPGDGSVWRFMATDLTGDLGKLVSYTDPRGRVLTNDDFGVDIVRSSNGLLRQVLTPSRLADIVTHAGGYTVSVYPLTDTDTPSFANGLYAIPPHDAVEVLTVDRGDDINHLTVTLRKGGASALKYDYTYVNGDWMLARPDGVVDQKEIYYGDDENTAQLIHVVKDSAGHVYSQKKHLFVSKSWGFAVTNQVEGFGSATRSTSWTYVGSGAAIGKVSEKKDSTGAIVQYGYDGNGRCVTETHPNRGEVVTTSYVPVDPSDKLLLNDIRPRTIVRTINAIEVERTYYAYLPTQEIVERAATQGSAYGAAGNLHTVTTWYPAAEDDYSAGRVKSVRYEDGQLDLYTYSWVNSIWTETVTRVHEQEPDPVAMQTTRRLNIYSRVGNLVEQRTELMTAAGVWEQIDGVAYEYNVNGRETKRMTFNGLITTSEWAGTCCGKSSETAPDGTRTTFTYDDSGRLIVRTVLDPNPIETHIGYDALGRQIISWTTNRVAHLGTMPLRTTYDALGRIVSQTDNLGNVTTTTYSTDAGTKTVIYPIGVTNVVVTGEDGRILFTGMAKSARTYVYGVNMDGSQWTTEFKSTNAAATAWTKVTVNFLGHTLYEEMPGYGNSMLKKEYLSDDGGRILCENLYARTNSNTYVVSRIKSQYDFWGNRTLVVVDANIDDDIDFSGSDRISGTTYSYTNIDSALWYETVQYVYPEFGSTRTASVGKIRKKLTQLNTYTSVLEKEDAYGNVSVESKSIVPTTGETRILRKTPYSEKNQTQLYLHGFLVMSVSTVAETNKYGYDGLNRRLSVVDSLGNLSSAVYDKRGLLSSVVISGTNTSEYVYDETGRIVQSIDSIGNSTFYEYDLLGNTIRKYGSTYPTEYSYDSDGNMTSMRTFQNDFVNGNETQWIYDDATGLLNEIRRADGNGQKYYYSPEGKLQFRKWARGVVSTYTYGYCGDLAGVSYSDGTPTIIFKYNRLGGVCSAFTSGVCSYEYIYDKNNFMITSENSIINGITNTVARKVDSVGRLSSVENKLLGFSGASLQSTLFSYSLEGRLKSLSVSLNDEDPIDFEYTYRDKTTKNFGWENSLGYKLVRVYEANSDYISAVSNLWNNQCVFGANYVNDKQGRRVHEQGKRPANPIFRNFHAGCILCA